VRQGLIEARRFLAVDRVEGLSHAVVLVHFEVGFQRAREKFTRRHAKSFGKRLGGVKNRITETWSPARLATCGEGHDSTMSLSRSGRRTTKLTGGNEAQRNCRPLQRLGMPFTLQYVYLRVHLELKNHYEGYLLKHVHAKRTWSRKGPLLYPHPKAGCRYCDAQAVL
jgi:hypothetical protein